MAQFRKRTELVIGSETDDLLIAVLAKVLEEQHAVLVKKEAYLVGSQDIFWAVYKIGSKKLTVRSETYEGITLSGPTELVRTVAELVVSRKTPSTSFL